MAARWHGGGWYGRGGGWWWGPAAVAGLYGAALAYPYYYGYPYGYPYSSPYPYPYPPPAYPPAPGRRGGLLSAAGRPPARRAAGAAQASAAITYTDRPAFKNAAGQTCREYQAANGALGTACQDASGQWRVAS